MSNPSGLDSVSKKLRSAARRLGTNRALSVLGREVGVRVAAWKHGSVDSRLAAMEASLHRQERAIAEVRSLVGPFGVPIGDGTLLVQTLQGTKYFVRADDLVMTPQLVVYRQWEAELLATMLRFFEPGRTFVDVGANFGYFSVIAASKMGPTPGSRVIAVEPNPGMLELLDRNLAVNWALAEVRVERVAVWNEDADLELVVPTTRTANAAIASEADVDVPSSDEVRRERVRARSLDSILRDEKRVDLIKIDVEGFEQKAFMGATETLGRADLVIVFEWSQGQMRRANFEPMETIELLRARGFSIFDAEDPRSLESAECAWSDEAIANRGYANFLARRV